MQHVTFLGPVCRKKFKSLTSTGNFQRIWLNLMKIYSILELKMISIYYSRCNNENGMYICTHVCMYIRIHTFMYACLTIEVHLIEMAESFVLTLQSNKFA